MCSLAKLEMHLFPKTVNPSEVVVTSENQACVLTLRGVEGGAQDLSFLSPSFVVINFLKYFCRSCTFFLSLNKAFARVAIEQGC